MEPFALNFSTKNIPIPSNRYYLKCLLEKTEDFVRRMRWRAFFFDAQTAQANAELKFGFRSRRHPPPIKDLERFEEDLLNLVRKIKFRRISNSFQRSLKEKLDVIRKSEKIFIQSDKTRNLYGVDKQLYSKLLSGSITTTYKKSRADLYSQINSEAKGIATELKIEDRVEYLPPRAPFVTLKDHKPNFHSNPKCRLINPAKTELGLVSKHILDGILLRLRRVITLPLWDNSKSVINWFKGIADKRACRFTQFDLVDFYPSITRPLLIKALNFARSVTTITDSDINIILHARKSLLFSDGATWVKKNGDELFDVPMGAFDGAELCMIIGAYILDSLNKEFPFLIGGLYRDDGLILTRGMSGHELDRFRKDLIVFFRHMDLGVIVDTNLSIVNFLDVTLDLEADKFRPYRKPNDNLFYINRLSNHPPCIIENLVPNISKRISSLSADEATFNSASSYYNEALSRSGFTDRIQLESSYSTRSANRRARYRKVLWFNPAYSLSVRTNIGKEFLNLVSLHFPSGHKYHKIFNRGTLKVSYSCTKNFASSISQLNAMKLAERAPKDKDPGCNCMDPSNCPLEGKCLTRGVVYRAKVQVDNAHTFKTYVGLTCNSFKSRFYGHKNSFKHIDKKSSTSLSKYIWFLKNSGAPPFKISWSILEKASPYKHGSYRNSFRCPLCLTEKLFILSQDSSALNLRSELLSQCLHSSKFLLSNWKPPND